MDFKNFLPSKDKGSKELYWALLIEPGWVQAGIWRISEDKAQLVFASLPTAWELEEELVQAVDASLSSAIQNLAEDASEPSKTVFGVVSSWVAKGEIKHEYLEKIKRICSDLSLEPAGFVVLPEAIAHLVKSEEGSPLSAVVMGVSSQNVELSVFRLGNLAGTSQVARSVSVVDDVTEGLARFSDGDPLPSRFILYDGKKGELEEVKRALLKANWDDFEKLKFLHPPKIEAFSAKRKINAVALAGASEIADVSSVSAVEKEKAKVKGVQKSKEDIANIGSISDGVTAEDLGFVLGKDVVAEKKQEPEIGKLPTDEAKGGLAHEEPKGVAEVSEDKVGRRPPSFDKISPFRFLDKLKRKSASFLDRGAMRGKIGAGIGKRAFILGGIILVSLILLAFLLWWYYPKATVSVYVSPKKLDEKVLLSIDPSAESPDIFQKILPGEVLERSTSGDRTKGTTGTKTVGERAKGEVTLYRVGPKLTLPSGTSLHGPNDLGFSLDESVTVASGSAGTPGTTKALVTAVGIGAQYNLASETAFSVSNYSVSDIEAKNEASFSGGTSREISAVSESDQNVLEDELAEELKDKARKEFAEGLASDKLFIEESLSATPSSRTFSNKVGDEAETLKLSLSLDVSAIAVDKLALVELVREVLKDEVPSGFVLRDEQIEVSFGFAEEIDGVFKLTASISANLLPEVFPEEVAKKIAGRYPPVAKQYLIEEVPGFTRVEINFNPKLPGRLGTLPRVAKNIEVEVAAER